MSNLQDLLSTDITANKTTKKHKKYEYTEEERARRSLAMQTRDPEKLRQTMSKLGKKPKAMTEKRLRNLRKQQKTLASREDSRKGGYATMSKPENRRKIMRKLKGFVNLTDEEFEERMKEMDKRYEQQTTDQQISSDITSKDSSKDNV